MKINHILAGLVICASTASTLLQAAERRCPPSGTYAACEHVCRATCPDAPLGPPPPPPGMMPPPPPPPPGMMPPPPPPPPSGVTRPGGPGRPGLDLGAAHLRHVEEVKEPVEPKKEREKKSAVTLEIERKTREGKATAPAERRVGREEHAAPLPGKCPVSGLAYAAPDHEWIDWFKKATAPKKIRAISEASKGAAQDKLLRLSKKASD